MIKKMLFTVLALLIIGGGAFYFINSADNYDANKYSVSTSDSLLVGSKLDFTLPDQFDKSYTLDNSTKKLIFTFSKKSSHVVKNFLKFQKSSFLKDHNALYLADISPMPVVIRNAFAMPDLKKSAYSVLLMYKDEIASNFRNAKKLESITIVTLKDKVVTSIEYVLDDTELKKAL